MHRVILHRDELRKWTWLWDPKLGGLEVKQSPLSIQYRDPRGLDGEEAQGAVSVLSGGGVKGQQL